VQITLCAFVHLWHFRVSIIFFSSVLLYCSIGLEFVIQVTLKSVFVFTYLLKCQKYRLCTWQLLLSNRTSTVMWLPTPLAVNRGSNGHLIYAYTGHGVLCNSTRLLALVCWFRVDSLASCRCTDIHASRIHWDLSDTEATSHHWNCWQCVHDSLRSRYRDVMATVIKTERTLTSPIEKHREMTWRLDTCLKRDASALNQSFYFWNIPISDKQCYKYGYNFLQLQCVQKKETKMFFCNIFHKTRAILMKFGVSFPNKFELKMMWTVSASPE